MFKRIPDGKVLVRNKGNYKELELYTYKNEVFAKFGSSYFKLMYGNLTSNSSFRWIEVQNIKMNYKNSVMIYEQVQDS